VARLRAGALLLSARPPLVASMTVPFSWLL
jgi:hypothetical protein